MIRTIFGRSKGEFVFIPIQSYPRLWDVAISTRKDNIDFGGTSLVAEKYRDYVTNPIGPNDTYQIRINFSPNFEGDVPILLRGGKKDVYSVYIMERYASGSYRHSLNIQDFGQWINQFTTIYSFHIYTGNQGIDTDIIKGDFSQMPDSLEKFKIGMLKVQRVSTDVYLNISNFSSTSKLKYLDFNGLLKFSGDLKYIPSMCTYFKLATTQSGNIISYSGGKTWASAFDTLYLPLALTNTENDRLLIDMAASIVSAVGNKVIYLKGNRTAASDVAVTYLQSLGFTITGLTRI